ARYEVVPIAITKDGHWLTGPRTRELLETAQRELSPAPAHGAEVTIVPEPSRRALVRLRPPRRRGPRPGGGPPAPPRTLGRGRPGACTSSPACPTSARASWRRRSGWTRR